MADRPILFSAPMVRALLDGRKTQTRRLIKPTARQVAEWNPDLSICPSARIVDETVAFDHPQGGPYTSVPLRFAIGDRLWVKETTRFWSSGHDCEITYIANGARRETGPNTGEIPDDALVAYFKRVDKSVALRGGFSVPSIFLPRWASRLTLIVTEVRVERLQDCSPNDVRAEGVDIGEARQMMMFGMTADERAEYRKRLADMAFAPLWNSINGAGAWEANPWVVAVTFTVEQRNIDAPADLDGGRG